MDTGFFKQEHVNELIKMTDLSKAKDYVNEIILAFLIEHPQTKPENIRKANAFVMKARKPQDLAFSVQNFLLAHPSEGLGVL